MKELDQIYCNGSLWEDTIFNTPDFVVKVVAFENEQYKVIAYRLIANNDGVASWTVAYHVQFIQPHIDEILGAITSAFEHIQ